MSLKRKRAKQMLPKFLALIRQFELSPAKALTATLLSWLEPIVRMWRFTNSNGITEGFHTKMEMLSRRAYPVVANAIMSPSAVGKPYSLFLPRLAEPGYRIDKTEADSLADVVKQFENAIAA